MCNRIPDPPDGILDGGEGRMRAAQAKWGRLSEHDLSGIRNKQTSSSVFKSATAYRTGGRSRT